MTLKVLFSSMYMRLMTGRNSSHCPSESILCFGWRAPLSVAECPDWTRSWRSINELEDFAASIGGKAGPRSSDVVGFMLQGEYE